MADEDRTEKNDDALADPIKVNQVPFTGIRGFISNQPNRQTMTKK